MLNLASQARSRSALTVGGLLVALATLLPVPASADPSQAEVAGACKRTKGCWSEQQPGAVGIIGCSPHACFSCNGVTCHQLPRSSFKRPVAGTARGSTGAGNASAVSSRHRTRVTVTPGASAGTRQRSGNKH
jgi:hypothetical protein